MSIAAQHEGWLPEFTLAERLRKIRRDLHLTQEEFAARLNVKPERLGGWESGRNRPKAPVEVAQLIEDEFGVPAWWTLGLRNEAPRPGGPGGGLGRVRHQGLEPRTRWFSAAGRSALTGPPRFGATPILADAA